MRTSLRLVSAAAAFALAAAAGTPAAAWTKSWVAEWYELAFYYGGPQGGSPEDKGTDCPQGLNPANNYRKILVTPYRTQAEVDQILDPNFNRQEMYRQYVIRGPNKENILTAPWSIPDPGIIEVQGQIAEGFDLDNNPNTGFTSPTGQKGIDHAFYKASGCILRFRGAPRQAAGLKYSNDGMKDGVYTLLIVLSGDGPDPMNDPSATLGIHASKDRVVKDALGGVAYDYSFRIDPNPKLNSQLKVKVVNGVIQTAEAQTIHMRDFWTPDFFPKEMELLKGQVRFQIKPDGTLSGMVGGYRDWREHYRGTSGNGQSGAGAIHENIGRMSMPAWWHALQRNADGLPDPKTGKNIGISTAYRIDAVPAFVAPLEQPVTVAQAGGGSDD